MHRIAILVLLVAAACGSKPDRAKAQAACEHVVELGFWEAAGEKNVGHDDPETKALLEDQKKGPLWKESVDKCIEEAMSDSSPAQVDCVIAAKTSADIDNCK